MKNLNALRALAIACFVVFTIPSSVGAQRYSAWGAPENVGPPVSSAGSEGCAFISKDNLLLFFASVRAGGAGLNDIYVSQRETPESAWGTPVRISSLATPFQDYCPTLSTSGKYLFFASNRPGGCGSDDLYVSRLEDKKDLTSFSEPVNLGCQVNSSASDITPSLFEDESGTTYLYFSSARSGGAGGMDIYVSLLGMDGIFSPASAVTELNTASNDARPNIRVRDGLEIFFESDRLGTLGASDLYSAVRSSVSDPWSTPVNLGSPVNSEAGDGRPSLSWDGTELYFMSGRPGGLGAFDVYVTRRAKLTGR